MFKTLNKITAAIALASASAITFAQTAPTNAADLGESVSMADATAGLLAVAGVVLAFYVLSKGVDLVLRKVRSA